jgi:alkanesulfonate monooxygenase SsuD/methylene tetrahydromethanopterin reductase-like flavin-dependent oxidoreductase (luciferase family)
MPDIDIDIAARRPLRLGIDDRYAVWLASPGEFVRVRGMGLRQVARRASAVRAERPGIDVLVDIDVVIANDAASALADAAGLPDTDTLRYVGTPCGLAGLIADLHALAITDGAILIPVVHHDHIDWLRDRILPELHSLVPAAFPDVRPA